MFRRAKHAAARRRRRAVASVPVGLPAVTMVTDATNARGASRNRVAAARAGFAHVAYTVDTVDRADPGIDSSVAQVATVWPGGVVDMHDLGHRQAVDALPRIAEPPRAEKMRSGRLTTTGAPDPDGHDGRVGAVAMAPDHSPTAVTVLVPAHNEGRQIASTLRGLRAQTLLPRRVIVIADNCDDETAAVAAAEGAEVYETVGNQYKKAGALNLAWRMRFRRVRDRRSGRSPGAGAAGRPGDRRKAERRAGHTGEPDLGDSDFVLVQDADSQLDAGFVAGAVSHLVADDTLGAVGGTFRGADGAGLVGHLQRNEYARYARDVRRLKGKCLVVTGTAAMFRATTLQQISAARRDGRLPAGDGDGGIYDTTVLTEDNEMTFAIRHLGYRVLSPRECTLTTEVMQNWRDLWKQRLRWKRGAVENCFQYGITRVTWPYWGRQLLTALGVVVTFLYLASLLLAVCAGQVHVQPIWLAVTLVFVLERAVTVRDRGWRYMLAAATMYELFYDIFLQLVHAKAYVDAALVRERRW